MSETSTRSSTRLQNQSLSPQSSPPPNKKKVQGTKKKPEESAQERIIEEDPHRAAPIFQFQHVAAHIF